MLFRSEGLECSPSTITVKGSKEVLSTLTEIVVPGSEVDISEAKEDIKKVVNISQYLPDGVKLLDPELSTVVVTATIVPMGKKAIEIETKNIVILNLNPLYRLKFDELMIMATLKGEKSILEKVDANQLVVQVNLEGVSKGSIGMNLIMKLPEGIFQDTELKVTGIVSDNVDNGNTP